MCQCSFINVNKCATLVGDIGNGGGYAYMHRVYGKSLYFLIRCSANLKLLQKIKSIF